jgi:hypothetical protein
VYDLILCTFVGGWVVRSNRGVRALDRSFVSVNPGGGCKFLVRHDTTTVFNRFCTLKC